MQRPDDHLRVGCRLCGEKCEKAARRCATENVDHLAFLLQLCELELIQRDRKAAERWLTAAKFFTLRLLGLHRGQHALVG